MTNFEALIYVLVTFAAMLVSAKIGYEAGYREGITVVRMVVSIKDDEDDNEQD